jgi:hypothetical protein
MQSPDDFIQTYLGEQARLIDLHLQLQLPLLKKMFFE